MGVYQVAGELYLSMQEYTKSRYYFTKMVQVNAQVNYLNEAVLHQLLLFKLDSTQGNFKEALRHYQHYKLLNDSIFNEAKSKQIASLQIQYETQAKVQHIELLTKKNEIQQAMLKQKDFQQAVFIIGSLLLLLLLVLVYSRYHIKQQSNKLLESKQQEINQKNESLSQLLAEKESLLINKDELLEEKEWLLKEIHHRVKNNLQIVMSLLNSQAAYLEDDKALSAIVDSQHRVRAMSLIHQKLYQSDKIATIAMEEYIKELVENLGDSYSLHGRIRFRLEIIPIEVDVVIAVPLGLLINEAVTNCLKYAFPQDREGIVYLSLRAVSPSNYLLTLADNGVGLVNTADIFPTRSLGMKLMKGLSKQLGGILTLENTDGLKISVLFTHSSLSHSYGIQAK
ncbi:sensor histidine kinase [Cytophagaceae bacterium BD1B2-1]|uniref:histidine kinase n=2 Tax=Xanthocytophaga agilis TaxID=3048010 RepID=A0AAE3R4W0_9BACT|nr:sensor histidine kinase [Xanthocytophaga agilis]